MKTGADVFLRKVRLERELAMAEKEDATPAEGAALGKIRELFMAGEEALKVGDKGAAVRLYGETDVALKDWLEEVKIRREEERGKNGQGAERRQAGETKTMVLPGGAGMEMVWCPAGTFTMGSPQGEEGRFGEETQHRVTLTEGFWLAKTEVTQKQWKSVMGNNPSHFKGDDLPVEQVSWNDCLDFCRKTGMRWPTEAEWEYACRAGSTGPYGGTGRLEDMGWFSGNSDGGELFAFRKTHPVGQKRANAWGLHDMHGNVWEWCEDEFADYPEGPVTDFVKRNGSTASGVRRVMRGGSWYSNARSCRSAVRDWFPAGFRNRDVGFRPVCSAGLSE